MYSATIRPDRSVTFVSLVVCQEELRPLAGAGRAWGAPPDGRGSGTVSGADGGTGVGFAGLLVGNAMALAVGPEDWSRT
jgi:hypothetical protein